MLAATRQHRFHNLFGDSLGLQRVADALVVVLEALEQLRARVALAHDHGAHFRRVVQRRQLRAQPLVER